MRLTSEELKAIYQQETARPSRQRAECLSADEMMRAAEGGMSPTEREHVADHLMNCADCVEEYQLVRSLRPWAATVAATVGDPQPQTEPESNAPRFGWRERLAAFLSPPRISFVMAAALLVISIALGVWAVSLYREKERLAAGFSQEVSERDRTIAAVTESLAQTRRQAEEASRQSEQQEKQIAELRKSVDELSQPQFNVPIEDLEPGPDRGPGQGATKTINIPISANLFTLVLHSFDQRSYAGYALEAVDAQGNVLWNGQGLRKSEDATFIVVLPRRLFPAGQYRLKLYGLRNGKRESLEDYAVRFQYR